MELIKARIFGTARIKIFNSSGFEIKIKDGIIVEDEEGYEFAEAMEKISVKGLENKIQEFPKVLKIMDNEDEKYFQKKLNLEMNAFDICKYYCEKLNIPLKLIQVRYSYDLKGALFIYTAAGRVDFRQLIKDLARELKIKIEMRQIGVRDEAKLLGGCGSCGYELCCSSYLDSFSPVSVKMAKYQGLVLNPSKILGVCGRLKCCLYYEYYEEEQEEKVLYEYDDDVV